MMHFKFSFLPQLQGHEKNSLRVRHFADLLHVQGNLYLYKPLLTD